MYRWVQRFTPELIDAARPTRHAVGDRWFVDETYVKVNGIWRYVYRAVDQHGRVIDVYVSKRRDIASARRADDDAVVLVAQADVVEAAVVAQGDASAGDLGRCALGQGSVRPGVVVGVGELRRLPGIDSRGITKGVSVRRLVVGVGAVIFLAGCTSTSSPSAEPQENRAVVIVSGGGARTPFTTPTEACSDAEGFLSAGNTATGLRDYLLAQGKQVYTAPVMEKFGPVADPPADSFEPFKDCPITLPETLTIMSAADIGWGGERLARFVRYLHDVYGVTDVDFVGHSNGGLWSRAATWVMKNTEAPVTVRSVTTLGTPHDGSIEGRFGNGEIGKDACAGSGFCLAFNDWWVQYADAGDKGINREDTTKFLDGPDGWNTAQAGALDTIPVTLLAGTIFEAPGGDPTVWPYDGVVSRYSGWAADVSDEVMPWRTCWSGPLTHSIFLSDAYNVWAKNAGGSGPLTPQPPLDWQTALTWNTQALARVNQAIDAADTALATPNRQGC